jgi:centrosomal protein CEP104
MSNLSKLKFRIVSCTSEDNDYPAVELMKHGPQCKGWQSARFQDFPQVIIFQFICPVHIQQLQFLSHHSKISSKIEIYTYFAEAMSSLPPMDQIKWKRLGYLSLDNNEKSNFQARELKSVFIDTKASYLKIALNKCHINKYNMFNQVGLIAINAMGEELGEVSVPSRKGLPPRLENELEFDPQTSERLRQLQASKDRAVENEDFDEAKKLREAIERLKMMGQQLYYLEERKRNAISNEDYDAAKVIKMEIDRLRSSIMPPGEANFRPFSGNRPNSRPLQQFGSPDFDFPPTKNQRPDLFSKNEGKDPFSKQDPYQKQDLKPDPFNNKGFSNKGMSHDEQVLPAVANGKGGANIYEEVEDDNPNRGNASSPEPLSGQQLKQAEPFAHILTEPIVKRIFSKNRQNREEGLSRVQNELGSRQSSEIFQEFEPWEVYTGVLGAVRYTIGDNISQVSMKSMGLLAFLIKSLPPNKAFIRGDSAEYLQSILALLLDKVGDNTAKVREIAEKTYMTLARSEIVGVGPAVQVLLKPNKEKASSQKHNLGRLSLLTVVVSEFRIDNSHVPFNPVVDYAITSYSNSNPDIRNSAYNLLMKIYECVGPKLGNLVNDNKGLRPAQIELLQKGFSEVESGSYVDPKAKGSESRINEPRMSEPRINEPRINEPRAGESKVLNSAPMCGFCGKNDALFGNQDNLDIHYWKDCPMLVGCSQCNQIVEIIQLNNHFLKECEFHELFKQCPRCKEAIHIDEYEQHNEEQACLAAKAPSKANRCALCHDDVDPGQAGWLKHILTEGCPNNDRSNY